MLEKNHRKVVFLCVQELTCHVILLSSFVPPYSYGIVYFNLSTFSTPHKAYSLPRTEDHRQLII